MPDTPTLFHFTCDHGRAALEDSGLLRPNMHPLIGIALVWLTDLDAPFAEPLGLTSHMLQCDRTSHRYQVTDASSCMPWLRYEYRDPVLEPVWTMPRHWWVSESPVPVVYAPRKTAEVARGTR